LIYKNEQTVALISMFSFHQGKIPENICLTNISLTHIQGFTVF